MTVTREELDAMLIALKADVPNIAKECLDDDDFIRIMFERAQLIQAEAGAQDYHYIRGRLDRLVSLRCLLSDDSEDLPINDHYERN